MLDVKLTTVGKILGFCKVGVFVAVFVSFVPTQGLMVDQYAAISLYTFLGCGFDGLACLATIMIDLEIAPHFDKPFISESFSSMWGRRWNMSVGNTLRVLIYDPIQEGKGSWECLAGLLQVSADHVWQTLLWTATGGFHSPDSMSVANFIDGCS